MDRQNEGSEDYRKGMILLDMRGVLSYRDEYMSKLFRMNS